MAAIRIRKRYRVTLPGIGRHLDQEAVQHPPCLVSVAHRISLSTVPTLPGIGRPPDQEAVQQH